MNYSRLFLATMAIHKDGSVAFQQSILHRLFKRHAPHLELSKKSVALGKQENPESRFPSYRSFHVSCHQQTNSNDSILVGSTAIMKFLKSRHIAYEKQYTNIVTACPKHGQVKDLTKCLYINLKSGKSDISESFFGFFFLYACFLYFYFNH